MQTRDPLMTAVRPVAGVCDPVQSFLFGHSRAEVVYDCR